MRSSRISLRHAASAVALTAALATVQACGASIVVIECDDEPGNELCGDDCVDINTDEENCGYCDYACGDGWTCVEGVCQPEPCTTPDCNQGCTAGYANCDGECVSLATDSRHCGACFKPCDAGQACSGSVCAESCACGVCDVIDLGSQTNVPQYGTTTGEDDQWEPSCSSGGGPDVAYRFVAPTSGTYVFDTQGSSFDTVVSVLSGCSEATCIDDSNFGTAAVATLYIEAGQEVVAIIDGYGGNSGNYAFQVYLQSDECAPLADCGGFCVDTSSDPFNCGGCFNTCGPDEFCSNATCTCGGPDCECSFPVCGGCEIAADLEGVPASFSGSTENHRNDLQPGCVGGSGPEVLHTFLALEDGTYVFDARGPEFDPVLSVMDAISCGELACNDDFQSLNPRVVVDMFAGQQVVVSVDSLGGQGSFYDLDINQFFRAECGAFIGSDVPLEVEGSTFNAFNGFVPPCGPSDAGDAVLTFVAPQTRDYHIDTSGSDFDTMLAILDADCGGLLLACNDDIGTNSDAAQIDIPLEEGQQISIIVDGANGEEGDYVLRID